MKTWIPCLILLFNFSLFSQQKGATPIPNTSIPNTSSSTYAVVVGISDYQDEGIPDLRFADKDAEAFAGFSVCWVAPARVYIGGKRGMTNCRGDS